MDSCTKRKDSCTSAISSPTNALLHSEGSTSLLPQSSSSPFKELVTSCAMASITLTVLTGPAAGSTCTKDTSKPIRVGRVKTGNALVVKDSEWGTCCLCRLLPNRKVH